jgi:hypothetical protein
VPVRVYATIATVGTLVAVILVFLIFFRKKPVDIEQVYQARAQASPSASFGASAAPGSSSAVPELPATSKKLATLPGRATTVASSVVDKKSGIGYAKFDLPWQASDPAPFSFVQRSGVVRPAQAMIASSPLPGATPKQLTSYSDYRHYAEKAAKWTLRRQPEGSRLVWTASQPVAHGIGWLLGYKITYVVEGRKHSSQAVVVVLGTGKRKPAMLFATVPDTDKALLRDLNTLALSVRPI